MRLLQMGSCLFSSGIYESHQSTRALRFEKKGVGLKIWSFNITAYFQPCEK